MQPHGAIQTIYKGYKFRSRLEARWAVFFDAMNIGWEYEPEGYEKDGVRYLPDFRLRCGPWVEVKPEDQLLNKKLLTKILGVGSPLSGITNSINAEWCSGGLLLLGKIPEETGEWPIHPIIQQRENRFGEELVPRFYRRWAFFVSREVEIVSEQTFFFANHSVAPEWGAEAKEATSKLWLEEKTLSRVGISDKALMAYRAARQARFEFEDAA